MGFFKNNATAEEQQEALEAMCPQCREALIDNDRLPRPDKPFKEFDGTPTHVLIDGVVPLCQLYVRAPEAARSGIHRSWGSGQ